MTRQVTPIPKRKPVKRGQSAASLKRKATTLHSMVVRARAGYACERCGTTTGQLQCAHIVSRRYTATRVDPYNAWCLCATCHRRLTEHPDEHVQFAYATRGEIGYAALRSCAYAGRGTVANATFWRTAVDTLSAELARLTK